MNNALSLKKEFKRSVPEYKKKSSDYQDLNLIAKCIKDLDHGVRSVWNNVPTKDKDNDRSDCIHSNQKRILTQIKHDCENILRVVNWTLIFDEENIELPKECFGGPVINILKDSEFIEKVIKAIDCHLGDTNLDVRILSETLGFSSNYIYRRLKSITGSTIKQFIRDYRLKIAAGLLLQDEIKVTEVLYIVGFSSPSYFSACFKQRYNCNPKEYRDKALINLDSHSSFE